jgi:hypothetical protein
MEELARRNLIRPVLYTGMRDVVVVAEFTEGIAATLQLAV